MKQTRDVAAVFLIELPVLFLCAGKGKLGFIISCAVYFAVCIFILYCKYVRHHKISFGIKHPFVTVVLCLTALFLFYLRWNTSGRIISIADILNKPVRQTCFFISFMLAWMSVQGIDLFISAIVSCLRKNPGSNGSLFPIRNTKLFIFLTAFLTITLNSTCSPLYPFNRWVDPNTTFTVGKAVLKGFVPYRDLYELKGPLFIFLHTIGAAVSFNSFLGIWILEVIFCFFFLYLSYKTLSLFAPKWCYILIPLLAVITYIGTAFRTGDSAEEFCLPLLAYGLYIGCKSIVNGKLPSKKEFFLLGVTSSCVFWIKYAMLGFYFGWYFVFLINSVIRKEIKEFLQGTILIAAGVIPVSALISTYFLYHSSFAVLLETYFNNNLNTMQKTDCVTLLGSTIDNLQKGMSNYLENNPAVFVISLAGVLCLMIKRQWRLLFFYLSTYVFTFIFVYIRVILPYYSFVMGIFVVMGFIWIGIANNRMTGENLHHISNYSIYALLMSLSILCYFSHNMFWLDTEREDLMQYKMKDVIEQSGIENPTIFYYGTLDLGINTVAGMIPNLRYFCSFNNINIEEAIEEQAKCINEGCVDFITAFTIYPDKYPIFEKYDHSGWFIGPTDTSYGYFHYYSRK